jgi:hypothetical protein
MVARKKMHMTARNNMHMTARKMCVVESKIIGMPTVTKQIKCTVIVDHLCWTQYITESQPRSAFWMAPGLMWS